MMAATIAYWAYAYLTAPSFRSIDGSSHFPAISGVFGQTETGWVVERHNVMVWVASDGTGRLLPILGAGNLPQVLFDTRVWTDLLSPGRVPWLPGGQVKLVGHWPDGTVTGRLAFVPIGWFVALFAVVPAFVAARATHRRVRRLRRARRVARIRQARSRLGRCACGYDLRQSASRRCPECGRSIRRVPVPWPTLSRP